MGNNQGTGKVYVGQSAYGGGIIYQGDGTPSVIGGSGDDEICLFDRYGGPTLLYYGFWSAAHITTAGSIYAGGNFMVDSRRY